MKLKPSILIQMVSEPFSIEETAQWWEKSYQADSYAVDYGSAILHKREKLWRYSDNY